MRGTIKENLILSKWGLVGKGLLTESCVLWSEEVRVWGPGDNVYELYFVSFQKTNWNRSQVFNNLSTLV